MFNSQPWLTKVRQTWEDIFRTTQKRFLCTCTADLHQVPSGSTSLEDFLCSLHVCAWPHRHTSRGERHSLSGLGAFPEVFPAWGWAGWACPLIGANCMSYIYLPVSGWTWRRGGKWYFHNSGGQLPAHWRSRLEGHQLHPQHGFPWLGRCC